MPQDIWEYKDPQRPIYPTQKNAAMLERIILTSSNPGDTVMDCYAGGGSTLVEAARLGRRFIGMDDAPESHRVVHQRMKDLGLTHTAEGGFTIFERSGSEQPSILAPSFPGPFDYCIAEEPQLSVIPLKTGIQQAPCR